ncbi:type VI secretion system ATPase TssH [Roseinatronobacter alkalisoli]|uniref:Type VI secretion system ATPase TssH n=1 Tax=Roseinatronobacter alkalisoli TaxID=3028235 RepID=A0ABT5TCL8_9RHOB|nr:type VI secretion system ATPase TssH [Roseinatronobacter sp. HJB301]MDD7972869.1 type VI secretion system ATPase TssH [Roseinatronobacter sp. HJB301]
MSEISLETVAGKLNRVGYDAFMKALRHAKGEGNRHVELAHWFYHLLTNERSDVSVTLQQMGVDRGQVMNDLQKAIAGFRRNVTEMPGISGHLTDALDRGWHYATLLFGESQIRSGHVLVAVLRTRDLYRAVAQISPLLSTLEADHLAAEARTLWAGSEEEDMRPMDGTGLGAGAATGDGGGAGAPGGSTALGRFAVDMTAQAESGKMDPIVGRDEEIRQIIDVLMRRRQNNPILTGEAGVGKTAVVEGFAQALVAGNVPPALQGVRLFALDIGLMQAGASMKGEFEQRLRSVIDEVQSSPTPIILFIDEAHTLIGAGGAAGTGDAANLLKPALARGTLRTVAATTWAEYRVHFEKDPALTRRFQPVNVDEPSIMRACTMLRGILAPMEAHHKVRIADEAVVAAVNLSARYLPARQLPDKAVSLLDTAAARVAISQSATPAMVADLRAEIEALEREQAAQEAQADLGTQDTARLAEIAEELTGLGDKLAAAEADYTREKELVEGILSLREKLVQARAEAGAGADTPADTDTADADEDESGKEEPGSGDSGQAADEPTPPDEDSLRAALSARVTDLETGDADRRMIYAHVDEQAVASVISDWTGIPVGRMVTDELRAILELPDRLRERVIGQDHGLLQIAKRIETNRAKLDNPGKPIGVFMLCGPSGVGKTETALALAEAIYGGEQNVITINMSEFQEAHTVSGLKGAPPGYVGYGEGGRLTEAVRRKPYSVVLLDEVEKAHPDVHELFFQVFDKGMMEDGTGRRIDFKNTVILLTSNVGTDVIMDMAARGETRPDPDTLSDAMRPHLQAVFPPALLGRIVTIPYFPLSTEVLAGIVRLKLNAIVGRMKAGHGASMVYTDAVLDHIVAQCRDPDSGGRMVDNIITNTILPDLSRAVLTRTLEGVEFSDVRVDMGADGFVYEIE